MKFLHQKAGQKLPWGLIEKNVTFIPLRTLPKKEDSSKDASQQSMTKALVKLLQVSLRPPLNQNDLVVMSFGLSENLDHMKQPETTKETILPAMETMMKEWKAWKLNGTAPKLIFRETS